VLRAVTPAWPIHSLLFLSISLLLSSAGHCWVGVSRYLVHNCTCPVLVVKTPGKSDSAASLIPGMDQLGSIVQSAS